MSERAALPILPTTVVGSYAIPAWLWAAWEKIEAGTRMVREELGRR